MIGTDRSSVNAERRVLCGFGRGVGCGRIQIVGQASGHTRGESRLYRRGNGVHAMAPAGLECRRDTRKLLHVQRDHHSDVLRSRGHRARVSPTTGNETDSIRDNREICITANEVKDVTTIWCSGTLTARWRRLRRTRTTRRTARVDHRHRHGAGGARTSSTGRTANAGRTGRRADAIAQRARASYGLDRPQSGLQGGVPRDARRQPTTMPFDENARAWRRSRKKCPSPTMRSSTGGDRREAAQGVKDVDMHVVKETMLESTASGVKVVVTTSTLTNSQLHRPNGGAPIKMPASSRRRAWCRSACARRGSRCWLQLSGPVYGWPATVHAFDHPAVPAAWTRT